MNMATGNSDVANVELQEKYLKDMMVIMGIFSEDAMRLSAFRCMHSGRKIITSKDVELGLKTRAVRGHAFLNDITPERIEEMKKFLFNDEEEMTDHEVEMTDHEEEMSTKICICPMCYVLNNIETEWDNWIPSNMNEVFIKNSINKTFNKDIDDNMDDL